MQSYIHFNDDASESPIEMRTETVTQRKEWVRRHKLPMGEDGQVNQEALTQMLMKIAFGLIGHQSVKNIV